MNDTYRTGMTVLMLIIVLFWTGTTGVAAATDSLSMGDNLEAEVTVMEQSERKTISEGIFIVEYPSGFESEARQVLNWSQQVHANISAELPENVDISDETIRIRLYDHDVSGYMNWHAHPEYLIDAPTLSYSDMTRAQYIRVLGHEYMNIVLHDHGMDNANYSKFWSRNPSWFREGLSDYYSYHFISAEIEDKRLPDRGVEERKQQIRDNMGYFSLMKTHQYDGGHLLAHYMMDTYNASDVFAVLATDGDFESAIESELNVTYDEFRREWLVWAETNIGGDYPVKVASIEDLAEIAATANQTYRDRMEAELDTKREEIERLESKLEETNSESAELERRLNETKARNEDLKEELDTKREEIERLESKLEETNSESAELERRLNETKARNEDLKEELDEAEDRNEKLRQRLNRTNTTPRTAESATSGVQTTEVSDVQASFPGFGPLTAAVALAAFAGVIFVRRR